MNDKKVISVYAHWQGFIEPCHMGNLTVTHVKGKDAFSFNYTDQWLKSGFSQMLDPDLQMYPGQYYPKDEKINFGLFLDSCPDRWGRMLMDRREAAIARQGKKQSRHLTESDYLLGVFDGHRMGGLRFKLNGEGDFLNNNETFASPPFTSLRELENASLKYEGDNINDKNYLRWINLLINPGSSLGGARPKAGVVDPKGQLWIAKFPSINDDKNVGAWEMVLNTLAKNAGLSTVESNIKQFNSKNHTYLSKRFDRNARGERIHFSSALTLLGQTDGAGSDTGVSYIDMANFIIQRGSNTNADLEELWRRIVFNISVKNTDDHLRNHGFLLSDNGWKLSPAFDMNPNEYGQGLSLNISEKDNALDLNLALSVSETFRVEPAKADQIINQVIQAVSKWKRTATLYGIPKSEQERMKSAFESNGCLIDY